MSLTDTAKLMIDSAKLGSRPQIHINEIGYTLQLGGEWWTLSLSKLETLATEEERDAARLAFGVGDPYQTEILSMRTVRGTWYIVRFRWKVETIAEQTSFAEPGPVEEGVTSYEAGA